MTNKTYKNFTMFSWSKLSFLNSSNSSAELNVFTITVAFSLFCCWLLYLPLSIFSWPGNGSYNSRLSNCTAVITFIKRKLRAKLEFRKIVRHRLFSHLKFYCYFKNLNLSKAFLKRNSCFAKNYIKLFQHLKVLHILKTLNFTARKN